MAKIISQGRCTEIKLASPSWSSGGGRRGQVTEFSPKSRKRLIEYLLRADIGLPLFVTLTYPGEYVTDARVYKGHLDAMVKRLEGRYGLSWVLWRIEFQRRGAPHYHLLTGYNWIDKDWLSQAWYDIVGSGDDAHLRAGTRVEKMRTTNGAIYYVSKYVAKQGDAPNWWRGRMWGVRRRDLLPMHPLAEEEISHEEAVAYAMVYLDRGLVLRDGAVSFKLYGDRDAIEESCRNHLLKVICSDNI